MAERFNLPVFTFIDTMGAYPGVGAEERGQAEAIATSLAQLSSLKVPVIATVLVKAVLVVHWVLVWLTV
jgi:acetyl-CoA carboxylase carboxyl transferase subunit alpha